MSTAVRKTISLPPDLAKDVEAVAHEQGKSVSAVIQDALRIAGVERKLQALHQVQGYWSRKACERGILTEKDLEHYLRK